MFSLCGVMYIACDNFEGDQTVPAFLQIDSIAVEPNSRITIPLHQQNSGFLTHGITSVRIAIDGKNLGVFDLPCSVPVLHEGKHDLTINAVIKQNGMAATRIYYPFYDALSLKEIEFKSGEKTTLNNPLYVGYASFTNFKWMENFESPSYGFDSITTVCKDPNIVKWGSGCGMITFNAESESVQTKTKDTIPITQTNGQALYLEMDFSTNTYFSVGMEGYSSSLNQKINMSAVTLKPTDGTWKKIYILLGKIWPQMGNPSDIQLVFNIPAEYNVQGAKVYFDNIKIVSY